MIISSRGEPDFLYFGRFTFGLHLLFFLLLLVKEFIVIDDFTNRWICLWRNFDQIKLLFLRHSQSILYRINTHLYIITYQPHLRYADHLICAVFLLLFFSESWVKTTSRLSRWKCHNLICSHP